MEFTSAGMLHRFRPELLLHPTSVAVIGADSVAGTQVMGNLLAGGFGGVILPVAAVGASPPCRSPPTSRSYAPNPLISPPYSPHSANAERARPSSPDGPTGCMRWQSRPACGRSDRARSASRCRRSGSTPRARISSRGPGGSRWCHSRRRCVVRFWTGRNRTASASATSSASAATTIWASAWCWTGCPAIPAPARSCSISAASRTAAPSCPPCGRPRACARWWQSAPAGCCWTPPAMPTPPSSRHCAVAACSASPRWTTCWPPPKR